MQDSPWLRDGAAVDVSWAMQAGAALIRDASRAPISRNTPPSSPRLLDRLRGALRAAHYSRRTEEAYVGWARRFILFHRKRHPAEMGAPELTAFLTALVVERRVSAATQNQALAALLFLYKVVLEVELPWLDEIVRAKRPVRLPVVLTRDEVREVLRRVEGTSRVTAANVVAITCTRPWCSVPCHRPGSAPSWESG